MGFLNKKIKETRGNMTMTGRKEHKHLRQANRARNKVLKSKKQPGSYHEYKEQNANRDYDRDYDPSIHN